MTLWIKRIHMYTGLLNFTVLVIFGIIGIVATVLPRASERKKPPSTVQQREFAVPGGMSDRQLADHIYESLNIPLTWRPPDYSLRRDDQNHLHFQLGTAPRFYDVAVLENEGRLQITTQPYDLWQYLFHLHEMTPARWPPGLTNQLWALYMEFSIWSLLAMALSGVYLWLASRPKYRWAQISFAVGSAIFVGFYIAIR
jgi:hypothetical protein